MTPKPKIGDFIFCYMKSGKIGAYRVTKVQHAYNVDDLFYANVEFIHYIDELEKMGCTWDG